MIISNFILQDEERIKNRCSSIVQKNKNGTQETNSCSDKSTNDDYCKNDSKAARRNSLINIDFDYNKADEHETQEIFKMWWNHYQQMNEQLHNKVRRAYNGKNEANGGDTNLMEECSDGSNDSTQIYNAKDGDDELEESIVTKRVNVPSLSSSVATINKPTGEKTVDSLKEKKNKFVTKNSHAMYCTSIRPRKKKRGKMTIRKSK